MRVLIGVALRQYLVAHLGVRLLGGGEGDSALGLLSRRHAVVWGHLAVEDPWKILGALFEFWVTHR